MGIKLNLKNKKPADNSSDAAPSGASSPFWKVLVLILVGVIILMATDVLEIRLSSSGSKAPSQEGGFASYTQDGEVQIVQPQKEHHGHEVLPRADHVQVKVSQDSSEAFYHKPQVDAMPLEGVVTSHETTPVTAPDPVSIDNPKAEPVPLPAAQEQDAPAVNENVDTTTVRHTYRPRGQPMSDAAKKAMVDQWGQWKLVDSKKDQRPKDDFYKKYPNRDVPRSQFPPNAWQTDTAYLDQWLPEALDLVKRAQESILAEYGKTEGSWEERSKMFTLERITEPLDQVDGLQIGRRGRKGRDSLEEGGWTTPKSWDGFVRRVLHAVMTEDSFVFAMGGHSAAAGHGNHFVQSYTLQVQWILEAVFARLGVRHSSRNFGNGGMGTLHNSPATGSIYGPDVDVLMWDSGMTENDAQSQSVLHHQGLVGGDKVPFLFSLSGSSMVELERNVGADVGYPGNGHSGIAVGESLDEIKKMPWAAQYVRCAGELHDVCRQNEYKGKCWIDRDDYTPQTPQQNEPGGRAGWHPGNRIHQVQGRSLAYSILEALKDALTLWKNADGYNIADDAWHVTSHYESVRSKMKTLTPETSLCMKHYSEKFPMSFVCNTKMKARTEFTPRAFPGLSNLRTLMPPEQRSNTDEPAPNEYQPPDVFNPTLHPPEGAIDVLNILEAGVDFESILNPDYTKEYYTNPSFSEASKVPVGKGLDLNAPLGTDGCDGSVDSWCKRGGDNNCMMYGHNDGRSGFLINGYSGWMVMNLPDVKEGIIMVKYESWHWQSDVVRAKDWNSINNERRKLRSLSGNLTASLLARSEPEPASVLTKHRKLGKQPQAPYCDDFRFEYAIDGKITSLTHEQWQNRTNYIQRVVELMTLMEDPSYTGGESKEVEVAVRLVGCGTTKVFSINTVYWA